MAQSEANPSQGGIPCYQGSEHTRNVNDFNEEIGLRPVCVPIRPKEVAGMGPPFDSCSSPEGPVT
jgi:hypothetical protein